MFTPDRRLKDWTADEETQSFVEMGGASSLWPNSSMQDFQYDAVTNMAHDDYFINFCSLSFCFVLCLLHHWFPPHTRGFLYAFMHMHTIQKWHLKRWRKMAPPGESPKYVKCNVKSWLKCKYILNGKEDMDCAAW